MSSEMKLRPAVRRFAEDMEKRLKENDWKGGWRNMTKTDLLDHLWKEFGELVYAITQIDCQYSPITNVGDEFKKVDKEYYEQVVCEAADVANFAMMIADQHRKGQS